MIADLKPYPEYQESDLPWLSSHPATWKILRGKSVFGRVDVRSKTGAEELLTVSANNGVIPRRQTSVTMFMAKSYIGHKLCWPGDLVVNSLWAWMQGLGVAKNQGLISSAYSVYRPRAEYSEYGNFFHHLFRSDAYKWELQTRSKGVWISRLQLSDLAFMDMPVLLPPPDEQAAIVRFLNHASLRIEKAIRAKRKVIALLNEQKQVIIHRAVTRGLDPNVRLKPSGVPWLGDIPEHWEVRRNGYLFNERIERGRAGLPVLVVSLRTGVTIGNEANDAGRERRLIADITSYKLACEGDIAYNMMRMWQGALGTVPVQGLVSPAYVVARPAEGVYSQYYELLFRTDACKGEINRNSRGIVSDRNRLYWDDFKRLMSPLPPLDEQSDIVEYLNREFFEMDRSIICTEREIDLLREYRTRLIADVVTGKLDVRQAAAGLPDDAEEVDYAEGTDDSADIDALDASTEVDT